MTFGATSLSSKIEGSVRQIGATGTLITDIANDQVSQLPADDTVAVKFGGHETAGIHPLPHDQPMGTLVAARGDSGFLEIEIVGVSVSEMLGIKTGEPVTVAW